MNKLKVEKQEISPLSYLDFKNKMDEELKYLKMIHDPKIVNFTKSVQQFVDMCNSVEEFNKFDLNNITQDLDPIDAMFLKTYINDLILHKFTRKGHGYRLASPFSYPGI